MNARGVECLGDFLRHVVEAGDGVEPRASWPRRIGAGPSTAVLFFAPGWISPAISTTGVLTAIGRDQRGAALRQARAAGHHRDADLAGRAGIAIGHRYRHEFVARVVGFDRGVAAQRAPQPHVAVAHQAEEIGHALGNKRLGNRFIGFHRAASPGPVHGASWRCQPPGTIPASVRAGPARPSEARRASAQPSHICNKPADPTTFRTVMRPRLMPPQALAVHTPQPPSGTDSHCGAGM